MTPSEMLREWETACYVEAPEEPTMPSTEMWSLRETIQAEEWWELNAARSVLAFSAMSEAGPSRRAHAEYAKELCDVIYTVWGTGIVMGYDMDAAFAAVHASNMTKLGRDGRAAKRADGKILKGPDYEPPAMEEALFGRCPARSRLGTRCQDKAGHPGEHIGTREVTVKWGPSNA